MFYLIGLGLFDEKDVSVRGMEVRLSNKPLRNEQFSQLRTALDHKKLLASLPRVIHKHFDGRERTTGKNTSLGSFIDLLRRRW